MLLLFGCGDAGAEITATQSVVQIGSETPTESPTEPMGASPVETNEPEASDTPAVEGLNPTETISPTTTPLPSPDDWQIAPVIPIAVSERALAIYQTGLEMGNNPHAFSKVGDCGGTPSWFLGNFDDGEEYYSLGDYQELVAVIEYFTGSFDRQSMAVSPGYNASTVFSPIWANPEFCESGEGPLECEYRIHNPSVALIMLGTNDFTRAEGFEDSMRRIIEFSIEQGVLPIISSKADNLEGDGSINRTLYKLALEYELPFWNFWAVLQDLPDEGLQEDGAHLTFAGNFFDDPVRMLSGWPWRNLTALQALDAVGRSFPDYLP
ncbi:MAG: hypothetical protein FVQ83_06770 [Chloroflexi bacterium]|nr:hypothetical protein [Chloroflexota bacterium]